MVRRGGAEASDGLAVASYKRSPKQWKNNEVKRLKMILAAEGDSSSDDPEANVVAEDTGGGGDTEMESSSDAEVVNDYDEPNSDDCVDVPESPAARPPPPRKLTAHISIASSIGSEAYDDPSRPVPPPGLEIPSGTHEGIGYDRAEHRQRVKSERL